MKAHFAAALVLLPESPRWLVVQGQLDAALAVIHRVLTNARLPQGTALTAWQPLHAFIAFVFCATAPGKEGVRLYGCHCSACSCKSPTFTLCLWTFKKKPA